MKETGIIMSGNHPQLVIDGTKTMTRRVIKLKGYHRNVWDFCVPHNGTDAELLGQPYLKIPHDAITDNAGTRITCPYGQVGDHLWVKETWMMFGFGTDVRLFIHYKASEGQNGGERLLQRHTNKPLYPSLIWRSSMFMPKAYSRITLEITEVRVERLQEITKVDMIAEGILSGTEVSGAVEVVKGLLFTTLWDSLNAKRGYGWDINPWIWVISFRRIEP